jgi:hypothetical protein
MVALSSWGEANWFSVIQTAGIMGSLWLAMSAARQEAKAKEIDNLLTIAEHHCELWGDVHKKRELDRIFQTTCDGLAPGLTVAEEEFINLAIVHYLTGWRIAKSGGLTSLKELGADVRGFFSLPLPRAVWEKTKNYRNRHFVKFVGNALCKSKIPST